MLFSRRDTRPVFFLKRAGVFVTLNRLKKTKGYLQSIAFNHNRL
jgi:hypothetical protein